MRAEYSGIHSEAIYYVPLDAAHEVWSLCLKNTTDVPRSLTVTGYAEFTNHPNYEQDQVNLQYSLFITKTRFDQNRVTQLIHGNLDALPEEEQVDNKNVTERFFGLAGANVSSWCGDKAEFIGRYHGYADPQGVIDGDLKNIASYNENSCGAISCQIDLQPGETKNIAFLLGECPGAEAEEILAEYQDSAFATAKELAALKDD